MENESGIVFAGLMPHAPVLIPEVGRGRELEAGDVVEGMRELSRRALAANPDRLIIVSPHTPRHAEGFGRWSENRIRGDLRRFGTPEVVIDLPNDVEFGGRMKTLTKPISGQDLDHGASVPLYFLADAGWDGPTTLVGLAFPGMGDMAELGRELRNIAKEIGGHSVFIASGDMSHALKPGAPAGYNPRAQNFDDQFVEIVKAGNFGRIVEIDPELRELAAEDVVDSTLMAVAVTAGNERGSEFLAYQNPFGVGYSVAVMFDGTSNG